MRLVDIVDFTKIYVLRQNGVMKKGEVFTEKNLRIVRPGNGLHPRYYEKFIGKKVSKDVEKGVALNWNHVLS